MTQHCPKGGRVPKLVAWTPSTGAGDSALPGGQGARAGRPLPHGPHPQRNLMTQHCPSTKLFQWLLPQRTKLSPVGHPSPSVRYALGVLRMGCPEAASHLAGIFRFCGAGTLPTACSSPPVCMCPHLSLTEACSGHACSAVFGYESVCLNACWTFWCVGCLGLLCLRVFRIPKSR